MKFWLYRFLNQTQNPKWVSCLDLLIEIHVSEGFWLGKLCLWIFYLEWQSRQSKILSQRHPSEVKVCSRQVKYHWDLSKDDLWVRILPSHCFLRRALCSFFLPSPLCQDINCSHKMFRKTLHSCSEASFNARECLLPQTPENISGKVLQKCLPGLPKVKLKEQKRLAFSTCQTILGV